MPLAESPLAWQHKSCLLPRQARPAIVVKFLQVLLSASNTDLEIEIVAKGMREYREPQVGKLWVSTRVWSDSSTAYDDFYKIARFYVNNSNDINLHNLALRAGKALLELQTTFGKHYLTDLYREGESLSSIGRTKSTATRKSDQKCVCVMFQVAGREVPATKMPDYIVQFYGGSA